MTDATISLLKAAIKAWLVMDVYLPNNDEAEGLYAAIGSIPEAMLKQALAEIMADEKAATLLWAKEQRNNRRKNDKR